MSNCLGLDTCVYVCVCVCVCVCVSVIRAGTKAAEGVPEADMVKRQRVSAVAAAAPSTLTFRKLSASRCVWTGFIFSLSMDV